MITWPTDESLEEECGDSCGMALSARNCEVCEQDFAACYDHETYVLRCETCREI